MASREEMIKELRRREMISELKKRDAANAAPTDVVQEQSPGVSTYDRFLIKNFATNPEVGVKYLQEKNPGADVRNVNGQTIIKMPGETQYKVLDPDTGMLSADLPQDLLDISGDFARGAASSVATGLGGATGGPIGAGAAGGAAGGGLEFLRQKLGQFGGLPQEVDPELIKEEAELGAAFGTGEKVLGAAGRFLKNKVLPKATEAMSGVPKEVWKDYSKNISRVDEFSKNPELLTNAVKDVQDEVIGLTTQAKMQAGQKIGSTIESATQAGRTVDITDLKKDFFNRITKAQALATKAPTQANKDFLEDLANLGDYFATSTPGQMGPSVLPNHVSPDVAMALKQQLKGIADYRPGAISKLKDPANKEITSFATKASEKITSEMTAPGAIPELKELNKNYKGYTEAVEQVSGAFKDLQSTSNTIKNLDKSSKDVLKARLETIAGPEKAKQLREKIQALQTQSYLGNPASSSLSGLGSTSTSRTIPLAGVGTLMGMAAGSKLGGGGYVPTAIGGAMGGYAGAKLGAPATLTNIYRGINAVERAPKPSRATIYGSGQSAWEALNNREE